MWTFHLIDIYFFEIKPNMKYTCAHILEHESKSNPIINHCLKNTVFHHEVAVSSYY